MVPKYRNHNKTKLAKRKMKRLMNFIGGLDLDQGSQKLIRGQLEGGSILQRVSDYNRMPVIDQHLYMSKLVERIAKITKPYKMLTVMLFLDRLMASNQAFDLPKLTLTSLKDGKSKQELVLGNMIRYYHYYLQSGNNRKYTEVPDVQSYCQMAIPRLMQFMKVDFIFASGWSKCKMHIPLLSQIVQSLLQQFTSDISILTQFVNKNINLILENDIKQEMMFRVNYLYERLIIINRDITKLQTVARVYELNVVFERYRVDKDLNRRIERQMGKRKQDKKVFMAERREEEKERDMSCNLSEIELDVKSHGSFKLLGEEDD